MPINASSPPSVPVVRMIAAGEGWCVEDVICRAGPGDRAFEEHHGWTSVATVMDGQFTYRAAQGSALMAPGAMLLGNHGTCFECGHEHSAGDRCIAFRFAPALVEEVAADMAGLRATRFVRASVPPVDRLVPLFGAIGNLARTPDPLRAEQVAISVLSTAFALDREARDTPPGARDIATAAEAARIIRSDFAAPLSIAGLARATGTTRRRLTAAFRSAIGVTPYHYVLNRRLDAAAERLRTSDATVLDIALDTGFGDLSEFTRRFRARFGCPPAAFRKQARL